VCGPPFSYLIPYLFIVTVQEKNCLLVCCLEGEVLEIECPGPQDHDADVEKTFHMASQTTRTYKFLSIKSKILVQ